MCQWRVWKVRGWPLRCLHKVVPTRLRSRADRHHRRWAPWVFLSTNRAQKYGARAPYSTPQIFEYEIGSRSNGFYSLEKSASIPSILGPPRQSLLGRTIPTRSRSKSPSLTSTWSDLGRVFQNPAPSSRTLAPAPDLRLWLRS